MKQKYSLYQSLANRYKKREKYFKDFRKYAKIIKNKAKKIFKDAKVIVFDSIIKGNYGPDSDIDLLIISKNIPEEHRKQVEIKYNILKSFKDSPFEIHLATPEMYENWYKKFIKNEYIEI